jgi:hypothetical protein
VHAAPLYRLDHGVPSTQNSTIRSICPASSIARTASSFPCCLSLGDARSHGKFLGRFADDRVVAQRRWRQRCPPAMPTKSGRAPAAWRIDTRLGHHARRSCQVAAVASKNVEITNVRAALQTLLNQTRTAQESAGAYRHGRSQATCIARYRNQRRSSIPRTRAFGSTRAPTRIRRRFPYRA